MKIFFIYGIVILITTSCTDSSQNQYYRTWEINSLIDFNGNGSIITDTVDNSFMTINNFTKYDTAFFRTCFEKPVNLWLMGNYSKGFYKTLLYKKVPYKKDSVNMIKCIFSLDSNREDHIISFLVLENIGIIYETNPSEKCDYILKKMFDTQSQQTRIDTNYVKSIYPANPIPRLK
jgi:hypothetical protein